MGKYPIWRPSADMPTQHSRRVQKALENPHREKLPYKALKRCVVWPLVIEKAGQFIAEYEYLGGLGASTRAAYALMGPEPEREILGVECFGVPPGDSLSDSFCPGAPERVICLERGACVPWAPRSAAGKLIKHAIEQAHRDHGWEVIIAYADENAGEIGGVYSGDKNWLYLGRDVGRGGQEFRVAVLRPCKVHSPCAEDCGCGGSCGWSCPFREKKTVQTRKHRQAGLVTRRAAEMAGWRFVMEPTKHVFVRFVGPRVTLRREYVEKAFGFKPFPTRKNSVDDAGATDVALKG